MRFASRSKRDEIFNTIDSLASRATLCASITRAVWHNDVCIARLLPSRSELARSHINTNSNPIQIIDPISISFSRDYDTARSKVLKQRMQESIRDISAAGSSHAACQNHRWQLAFIERLRKLWSPFGKQLTISATRVNENQITDDFEKQSSLAAAWAPTFSYIEPINKKLAEAFASKLTSKFDCRGFAPPSSAFYEFYLQ